MPRIAVKDIVTIVEDALYALHWVGSRLHVLDEMAVKLTNVEYLTTYFTKNEHKLGYYKIDVQDAILTTVRDVSKVIARIKRLADGNEDQNLDSIFIPLHNEAAFNKPRFKTDYKTYGIEAGWLRVYAVKCDKNFYVITGYGIKLDKPMLTDPLLVEELNKLRIASDYLKSEGFL